MSIIGDMQEIGKVLQKAGNIELYEKLISIQETALKLLEENKDLKEKIQELENQLKIKNTLVFKENAYYSVDAKGIEEKDPFCSNCWDTEAILIRLHETVDHEHWWCPNCKNYGGEIKD